MSAYEELKKDKNKNALMAAYERYTNGDSSRLFAAVYGFVDMKIRGHLEYEFGNEDMDEIVQDTTAAIICNVEDLRGKTPESFYAWVNSITYRRRVSAFKKLLKKKQTHTTLEVSDDNGNVYDNPELYDDLANNRREWRVRLPDEVQGVDRRICHLLMDGKSYADVAYHLSMTADAVRMRLARLRERMKGKRPELLV